METDKYVDAGKLREAFLADLRTLQTVDEHTLSLMLGELEEAPAADVAPVVRAEWMFAEEYGQLVTRKCSLCGQTMTTVEGNLMNFCPNCGAKMERRA